jgi:DNA-binding response OmpR family regulator
MMATDKAPTVLLVEDEPIIRMAVAEYLRGEGYTVVEAGSGDRAMDIIRSGKSIDIIVTDVQMPGEHDGVALALWARRTNSNIRLIIVSGAMSGTVALDVLGDEGRIIPKPYRYEEIVDRIRELLDREDAPAKPATQSSTGAARR